MNDQPNTLKLIDLLALLKKQPTTRQRYSEGEVN